MSCLSCLPDEVLKTVMQHVPLRDRLTCCCLVNRRLHAAAIAATQELQLEFGIRYFETHQFGVPHHHADCVWEWLSHFGQHLTSLGLAKLQQPLQQLPCPNLLQLSLRRCSVQLGPAAGGLPDVFQCCTKLTHLELRCNINAPEGGEMDSLSTLVHLESLSLMMPADADSEVILSQGTLPCLTRLTSIRMSDWAADNVVQLGVLTNLQELELLGSSSETSLGPSSVPGLGFPASLTRLELCSRIEAGVLSLVPTGLKFLAIECGVDGPAEGPDSLLSCMARLQHLTALHVCPEGDMNWPPPGPAYSALTASSSLVRLLLSECTPPGDVWPYVFPASHKLPHLTSFTCAGDTEGVEGDPTSTWGAAGLSNLVSCCPNLHCLMEGYEEYPLHLQHGPHVSELHKLTAVTSLCVQYGDGDAAEYRESLRALAAVTQLRDLWLGTSSPMVTVASLLPLTSLTTLTRLSWQWLKSTLNDAENSCFCAKQQASWDTPVWLQLLRRCAESDFHAAAQLAQQLAGPDAEAVQRAVTLDQRRQSSAHRQQVIAEGQRIQQQQQQLAALEGQVKQQAVTIAGLQGQMLGFDINQQYLSEQQQAMAQQGAQIAVLQAQLRELQRQQQ